MESGSVQLICRLIALQRMFRVNLSDGWVCFCLAQQQGCFFDMYFATPNWRVVRRQNAGFLDNRQRMRRSMFIRPRYLCWSKIRKFRLLQVIGRKVVGQPSANPPQPRHVARIPSTVQSVGSPSPRSHNRFVFFYGGAEHIFYVRVMGAVFHAAQLSFVEQHCL